MRGVIAVGMAVASLALVSAVRGQDTGAEGRIWLEGTSTVRKWSCDAKEFAPAMKADPGFEKALLEGQKAVRGVGAKIAAGAIECGNGKMNDHLRKALKVQEFPTISYELKSYEVTKQGEAAAVTARGELTIAGTTRPIEMEVTATPTAAGGLEVKGAKEIRMTEYGVKPPSLMLGTLKVGDPVTVHFDVVLKPGLVAMLAAAQGR
ncbi:MAG TPA: YceI family protein [Longimicrobiales bacterium]|nr:YceI family protein [Longimicrobiales bacterium]